MKIKNLLYSIVALLVLSSDIKSEKTTPDHAITVFVHGTFSFRKMLQHTPLRSIVYAQPGLCLARNLPEHYHFHKMTQGFVDNNPELYSLDQIYIFGWKSEHIYHSTRQKAAADLAQGLVKVATSYYQEHKVMPSLRVIGFSHGGNVVLNLANHLPVYIDNQLLPVDIWLFGTPVQQVNHHLINSKHFRKVYAIYSEKDWLQRMDPQGLRDKKCRKKHFWSDRTFDPNSSCIQVKLTINNQSICHSYYRYILQHFPTIQRLIEVKSNKLTSGFIAVNLEI